MEGLVALIIIIVIIILYLKNDEKYLPPSETKNNNINKIETEKEYKSINDNREEEKEEIQKSNNAYIRSYTKKTLMTNVETQFYNKFVKILEELELDSNYIIIPQVSLSSIIDKRGFSIKDNIIKDEFYQSELNRIIDFVIFNKNNYESILAIEINDKRHNTDKKVIRRDYIVKNICKNANLEIITFWLDKSNEYNYMKNRLKQKIEQSNIKTTKINI